MNCVNTKYGNKFKPLLSYPWTGLTCGLFTYLPVSSLIETARLCNYQGHSWKYIQEFFVIPLTTYDMWPFKLQWNNFPVNQIKLKSLSDNNYISIPSERFFCDCSISFISDTSHRILLVASAKMFHLILWYRVFFVAFATGESTSSQCAY